VQPPKAREVTRRLEQEGWLKVRTKGSHIRYRKGNRLVTIAGKPSSHLKRGTWKNIQKQAGW
jgi:predicted RNA binding protein YcfA (HicA-like mRNA interferase family)